MFARVGRDQHQRNISRFKTFEKAKELVLDSVLRNMASDVGRLAMGVHQEPGEHSRKLA